MSSLYLYSGEKMGERKVLYASYVCTSTSTRLGDDNGGRVVEEGGRVTRFALCNE